MQQGYGKPTIKIILPAVTPLSIYANAYLIPSVLFTNIHTSQTDMVFRMRCKYRFTPGSTNEIF